MIRSLKPVKMRTTISFIALSIVIISCNQQSEKKWSVRMVHNVMTISDSLHYYDFAVDTLRNFKLGFAYDVSMMGMALDKLGHIDYDIPEKYVKIEKNSGEIQMLKSGK